MSFVEMDYARQQPIITMITRKKGNVSTQIALHCLISNKRTKYKVTNLRDLVHMRMIQESLALAEKRLCLLLHSLVKIKR